MQERTKERKLMFEIDTQTTSTSPKRTRCAKHAFTRVDLRTSLHHVWSIKIVFSRWYMTIHKCWAHHHRLLRLVLWHLLIWRSTACRRRNRSARPHPLFRCQTAVHSPFVHKRNKISCYNNPSTLVRLPLVIHTCSTKSPWLFHPNNNSSSCLSTAITCFSSKTSPYIISNLSSMRRPPLLILWSTILTFNYCNILAVTPQKNIICAVKLIPSNY